MISNRRKVAPNSGPRAAWSERADDSTDGSLDQASGHLGGSFFFVNVFAQRPFVRLYSILGFI
jgi:hypothetical protein